MHPKILLNYSVWSDSREDGCSVHQTRAMWLIDRDFWSARFRVHRDPPGGAWVIGCRLFHTVLLGQILSPTTQW